jgi:hypothetical protein
MSRARVKVARKQCCQPKAKEGMNLVDPLDAMVTLLTKWVVMAYEPGQSNLHFILHYRLSLYQPYGGGNYTPSLAYFSILGHSSKQGSLTWNRIGSAWKSLVEELEYVDPTNFEEVMNENIWWSLGRSFLGSGFSKVRGAALSRVGLTSIRDIWTGNQVISALVAM